MSFSQQQAFHSCIVQLDKATVSLPPDPSKKDPGPYLLVADQGVTLQEDHTKPLSNVTMDQIAACSEVVPR